MKQKTVIISNKARCLLCKDVIESKHRHDYVTCSCGNAAVDGGKAYLRRAARDPNTVEELSEVREQSDLEAQEGIEENR